MLEKPEGANQEWTVERHWQYCAYKTQDENKQKKHNTGNKKYEQHKLHQKPSVNPGAR